MKKKNLKSLKIGKVLISNLETDTITGGITGRTCRHTYNFKYEEPCERSIIRVCHDEA